jgi:2-oxoglutarate dehydrogenase E1 component
VTAAVPHLRGAASQAPVLGVFGLVNAYRSYGHLASDLDPLGRSARSHPFLDAREYGLDEAALDTRVRPEFFDRPEVSVRELIELLQQTYCRTFAVEFMEMRDKERRDWLLGQMEPVLNRPVRTAEERLRILGLLAASRGFEEFLHRRFLGQKRFSLEGAESLIPMLDTLVEGATKTGAREIVIAMAHRGRLNVMAHTMGMPYRALFRGFQSTLMPLDAQGAGDVKYHRGYSADRVTSDGRRIHLSLCSNPSHLEAINPVAEGIARAKQNYRGDTERTEVIPLIIHGDAAFTGQGLVAETLALSELENYWTGGTIHVIVNNQIGFTTDPHDYRFTEYPSDMAKVIQAPVFHVNADDPEACTHAAQLAIDFRQRFREDVIIDLVCYRRHGHNEGDDPSFTQPLLYRQIEAQEGVASRYAGQLQLAGVIDERGLETIAANHGRHLELELEASTTVHTRLEGTEGYHGLWKDFGNGKDQVADDAPTAVSRDRLERVGRAIVTVPNDFHMHRKLERLVGGRAKALEPGGSVDWGTAEAFAIGTLLDQGVTVRMTGQDVERGTFSHRHAVLSDVETGDKFIPLNNAARGDARLIIVNSMLSEAAVLGFEYGYSTVDPNRLTIWEAQFGDFANGAQVIIDQFIASSETKWGRSSGLVMLLPHGYEGHGPEHSSARLERFLQLCAEDNMRVCGLTTPAQYFHALRRQIQHRERKPLVLMAPKRLLRLPRAVSPTSELEQGHFQLVLDDERRATAGLDIAGIRRVLVCSGKVYYTLLEAREESGFDDVAILRLEQIHPFPFDELRELLAAYPARDIAWVQEEPWNQGAWAFVQDRLKRVLPTGAALRYIGRRESASPATGSFKIHEQEEAEFVQEAFARRARPAKP